MKSFGKYQSMGCKILEDVPDQFDHLYQMTNGEVCEGCGHRGTSECGFREDNEASKKKTKGGRTIGDLGETKRFKTVEDRGPRYTLTNAQVADQFGISRRQVSRFRNNPDLVSQEINNPDLRAELLAVL